MTGIGTSTAIGASENLDLTIVLSAIQERMLGQDPMLERYGRVARAVLLAGEPFEPPTAHDFSRKLTADREVIGVTAGFDVTRSLVDMHYSRARGRSLRVAEVVILPIADQNPLRLATLATGFAEADGLKTGRIGDVIRNMGAKTATPAEIRHFIEELEDQIEVAGL